MKQIIQNLKNGETILEEIPCPVVKPGHVLIRTNRSLVSLGTERMLVEFGKANLVSKAKQQPEKVKQVLDKIKSDGLIPTLETVFNKLGQPLPLGYCNVGEVIELGKNVENFNIGDRVASNGHHAEFVLVPKNLVAKIPDNVSDDEACFTVIGAIGLQGLRLINPTFGETVVVFGLGLVGLLTAQLLMANGCKVIGIDLDQKKLKLAESMGVYTINGFNEGDPVKLVNQLTDNIGADGVIITASAKTNKIISQSAQMSRKKGRIVLVGVIGLDINRSEFFEKELSFQVSCSYGPGRYDTEYEEKGIDYPLPYVRWTEKRNFESILFSLSKKSISVVELITEKKELKDCLDIYSNLDNPNSIASILKYNPSNKPIRTVNLGKSNFVAGKGVIGIIGAGNFTGAVILPNLSKINAQIKYISSSKGLSSAILGKKHKIQMCTTDYQQILKDSDVDLVMVTTRHDSHANYVIEALKAGKNVFVEKPLALNFDELEMIKDVYNKANQKLLVGFNRRFSPFAIKMKEAIGDNGSALSVVATMNAGYIPADSWIQDMQVGGGRIIGEACHYIDFISYLTGSEVESVHMHALGQNPKENVDNAIISLKYKNGAIGTINYLSNGSKSYSKERIEAYFHGKTLILDNFRVLTGYGTSRFSKLKSKQDKGHFNQFKLMLENISESKTPLINFESIYNTTLTSIKAIESMKKGQRMPVEMTSPALQLA